MDAFAAVAGAGPTNQATSQATHQATNQAIGQAIGQAIDQATAAECAQLAESLQRQPPEIPPRYFYDDHGSRLFEQITQLPEYYQTRTETSLLELYADHILAMSGARHLAELGSGAGRKIRLLLSAGERRGGLASCTMLDVNELFLRESVRALQADYPRCRFHGVVGDFTRDLSRLGPGGERLIVFFAGTIGNLYPAERQRFLATLAGQMAASDSLLIGIDRIKDPRRLEAAYNDAAGITAEFNTNALRVLNRRFAADFVPEQFEHRAFYDVEAERIEMRLRAREPVRVRITALDRTLQLAAGDELRTEISTKFSPESFGAAAAAGGLRVRHLFTDAEQLFSLALLDRRPG